MNDVPLIQKADINSINTSIIAIKKQLKQLNEALGLVDVPSIDTSVFVKKSDVVDVVEADNMNPVTSNAVATSNAMPVDTVTSGNMHSVTSNAVSKAMSYSTTEHFTGKYWKNGKKIYSILKEGTLTAQTYSTSHNIANVDEICKFESFVNLDGLYLPMFYAGSNAFFYNFVNATQLQMRCASGYVNYPYRVFIEYTKTTD